MAGKSLTMAQQTAMKAYVRRELVGKYGDNQVRMAEAVGVRQSTINDMLHRGSAGPKTLSLLAAAGRTTIDAILGQAPPPSGDAPTRTVEREDDYPNRAAFLLLHGDQISAPTTEFVRNYARKEGDMPLEEWRKFAKQAEEDRVSFGSSLKTTGTGVGDAGGFGEAPPAKKRRR